MNKVISLLYIAYFFVSSAFLVLISATICLFTRNSDLNRRAVHMYSCWWGYHYINMVSSWKVKFIDVDKIDPKKAYVLVSNHQSLWDIMLLYGLYRPFKWVSKEEIFKTPFIGWNMELNQYVKLARGDLKSIKEMMATCRKWLNQGASIMIFPEGTRSPDGEMLEFRDGPFKLAWDCKVPVVPIVVDGTHNMLPKGSIDLNFNGTITVKVLDPVLPENFATVKSLRDAVRSEMLKTLNSIRGRQIELPETNTNVAGHTVDLTPTQKTEESSSNL